MTVLFTFTAEGKHYSFVDSYSNHLNPLPGDYVTFPVYSGHRSNCTDNFCRDCFFNRFNLGVTDYDVTPACQLALVNSPYMLVALPNHIKLAHPEFFI